VEDLRVCAADGKHISGTHISEREPNRTVHGMQCKQQPSDQRQRLGAKQEEA
jgi:hypothetical protein